MCQVEHLEAAVLLDTSVVEVVQVGCCRPRSVASGEEWNQAPQIVLPRRGLFMVHRGGESVLADPTRAIVFGLEEGYRVSHPLDGGDECVVLGFRAEIHEEAIGRLDGCSGRLSPRTQFGASVFVGAVGRDEPDALACEESAMLLLEALAGELTDASRAEPRVSKSERDRADQVRALLADDLARPWRLPDVARAVHCSPFHLARRFRMASGETISGYLLRLRLAAALHRIAEGERNLARLAVELGFSHHSHFSARFRSVFGCTPVRARGALTAPRLRDLSTILTADFEGSA
jgi:AraC family transcriptional regulator